MLLKLQGSIIGGPPSGVSTGYGTMTVTDQLGFPGDGLSYQVSTGVQTMNMPSAAAAAFVELQGVGPDAPVTRGTFLYAKTQSQIQLRLTLDDGVGGDIVSVIPLSPQAAPLLLPCTPTNFLKLLEAKGSGQLLYFVCGDQ